MNKIERNTIERDGETRYDEKRRRARLEVTS